MLAKLFFLFVLSTSFLFAEEARNISLKKSHFFVKEHIHIGNLKGQIEGFSLKLSYQPKNIDTLISLSSALYEYAFYTGNLDQIQLAINKLVIAETMSKKFNKTYLKKIYLMRAKQEMSLHRFDISKKILKKALRAGATKDETESLSADFNWNQGRYKKAITYFRNQMKKSRDMHTVMRVAILEHQLGNYSRAEKLYLQSIKLFQGNSPITLSWLKLQYGIHKLERGDYISARNIFIECLKITPHYFLVIEHLAETYALVDDTKNAVSLYKKVISKTHNPEFMGKLSLLYLKQSKSGMAKDLMDRATRGYKILLKKFPKAMYAHAAAFFMDHNQNEFSLRLLKKNVLLRPCSESYQSLAKVQLAMNLIEQAKESIIVASKMPLVSSDFCDLAKILIPTNKKVKKRCYGI